MQNLSQREQLSMVDLDRFTIERAAKGDKKAFKTLYDHYAPFVWRIVYRTAGNNSETAEEIVQDTFIRIHASLKKFSSVSALGTWIYRIAFNAANTCLAKRSHYQRTTISLTEDFPNPGRAGEDFETSDLVQKILSTLPAEDRFLLVAKEIDGLSFDQIAEITGKTSESLRTKMFRIREKIQSRTISEPLLKEAIA
jgi:RNA polymerase sigma-70 factor, ECF subfamily